jgi:hypothetical protein
MNMIILDGANISLPTKYKKPMNMIILDGANISLPITFWTSLLKITPTKIQEANDHYYRRQPGDHLGHQVKKTRLKYYIKNKFKDPKNGPFYRGQPGDHLGLQLSS